MGSKRDSFYLNVHISQGKKLNKKIVIIKGEWKRDVFFFLGKPANPNNFFSLYKRKGYPTCFNPSEKKGIERAKKG